MDWHWGKVSMETQNETDLVSLFCELAWKTGRNGPRLSEISFPGLFSTLLVIFQVSEGMAEVITLITTWELGWHLKIYLLGRGSRNKNLKGHLQKTSLTLRYTWVTCELVTVQNLLNGSEKRPEPVNLIFLVASLAFNGWVISPTLSLQF